jgi:hypothetical protein
MASATHTEAPTIELIASINTVRYTILIAVSLAPGRDSQSARGMNRQAFADCERGPFGQETED